MTKQLFNYKNKRNYHHFLLPRDLSFCQHMQSQYFVSSKILKMANMRYNKFTHEIDNVYH